MAKKPKLPKGVNLERSLKGFESVCRALAWSLDGSQLAAGSDDGAIRVWDAGTWDKPRRMVGHKNQVLSLSWAPDGRRLASGSRDESVGVWDIETGKRLHSYGGDRVVYSVAWSPDGRHIAWGDTDSNVNFRDMSEAGEEVTLTGHSGKAYTLAWSPDGSQLASGSADHTVRLWNLASGKTVRSFKVGGSICWNVAWSPDGTLIASTERPTIRVWEASTGKQLATLEGHSDIVNVAFFSSDGRLLASGANDGDIRLWRCDTWACSATLALSFVSKVNTAIAWHPKAPLLAASCEGGKAVYLFRIDPRLGGQVARGSVRYSNAKVVLVGDSGVGKTGLGLVLSGNQYRKTDSTHKRNVWTFQTRKTRQRGQSLTRETLLWDLAGQAGYRLVHQLSLNEVAVALVVFDARSETDPFAGVRHWDRALRQAQRAAGEGAPATKKLLIAARVDRAERELRPHQGAGSASGL